MRDTDKKIKVKERIYNRLLKISEGMVDSPSVEDMVEEAVMFYYHVSLVDLALDTDVKYEDMGLSDRDALVRQLNALKTLRAVANARGCSERTVLRLIKKHRVAKNMGRYY